MYKKLFINKTLQNNEFKQIIDSEPEGIKHKNYDENTPKNDIDVEITNDSFLTQENIDKKNEIIYLQEVQMYVAENRVVETKENAMNNISRNHKLLEERRIQLRNKLFNKENINYSDDIDNNKK